MTQVEKWVDKITEHYKNRLKFIPSNEEHCAKLYLAFEQYLKKTKQR